MPAPQARMSKPPSGNYSRVRGGSPATAPRASRVVPPNSRGRHFGSGGTPDNSPGLYRQARRGGGQANSDLQSVSPAAPKLAAEFLLAVVLIVAAAMGKPGGYLDRMSEILWRLTALTAVFFILALASMNTVMNKVSVQFGGLIVVAILLMEVKTIGQVFNVLAGKGTGADETALTADVTTDPPPHNILN